MRHGSQEEKYMTQHLTKGNYLISIILKDRDSKGVNIVVTFLPVQLSEELSTFIQ